MNRPVNIAVWDIWVRIFHWSLVLSVGLQLFTGLTGTWFFDWHRIVGELVLALIVFRLAWGLCGSSNARIGALVQSPVAALTHLRELIARRVPAERGHNAAGALAVVAMLTLIGIQAITGLFIADEDEWVEGAFYGELGKDLTGILYDVHHLNATLIFTLIVVHVSMILVYWLYARQNLIKPMLSGRMNWHAEHEPATLVLQKWWIGALLAIGCVLVVGIVVGWF